VGFPPNDIVASCNPGPSHSEQAVPLSGSVS
jgi:hypothetical protein